jgi:hypothetical protein
MKGKFTFNVRLKSMAFLVFLTLLVAGQSKRVLAQSASSYSYTAVAGTFTEITGTALTAAQSDTYLSGALPIGFTFNFCGTNYTTFKVSSNGVISFGAGSSTSGNSQANLNLIKAAVFPLWDDLDGATAGSAMYTTTGTPGSQVFTFQFKNWEWNWSANIAVISFQVKLYEGTNIVEFVYRQEPATGNPGGSSGASIGICDGAATPTYLSLNNSTATATASSTVFTTGINAKPANGQIYRFTPPPPCTAVTFPATSAATVSQTSVCVSGNVNLNITATMPVATGITYQWQESTTTATGPWTNIGTAAATPAYTAVGVNTPRYFRCLVLCNANTTPVWTSGASPQVTVNNPVLTSTTPGSRCGPGVVNLAATAPGGTSIKWYAAPTGGLPLFTGPNYTTNYIPSTTTFYATPASGTTPATQWVGTATTTATGNPNPYYTTFEGNKVQFLIKASELQAAGLSAGTINSIGFDVLGVTTTLALTNYTVSIGTTNLAALTTTFETGLTPVFTSPAYTVQPNVVNTHVFTTPFPWDGVSNVIIETCFANTNWNGSQTIRYSAYSYAASHYQYDDGNANQCTAPTGTNLTSNNRPNIQFGMTLGCEGTRTPVVATVNPSPAVTKTAPAVVCNNQVATITVASNPMTNYATYVWTPTTNLYTNPGATTPYTGGSATTVYMKTNNVGQQTYYMYASGTTAAACAFADTVKIWVQPDSVTIKGQPDTICFSGSTTLSLVPGSGYAPNSIQWQDSPDGLVYTDIAGANAASYATPVLNANRYYKALVKAGTVSCQSPVKYVVVANPQLASVSDSFNCGPGTVTLGANPTGNSVARWYDVPTLGLPVGTGNSFTTPYLAATTTYYVEAGAGGATTPPTWIGTGTSTSTSQPNPFFTTWWGNKNQIMVRATELQAAGFTAGNITRIAYDVLGVTTTLALTNFTIRLKNTTATDMSAWQTTGFQQVYTNPSYTVAANSINEFIFTAPFAWDGTSNIVIETCFNNNNWNGSQTIRYTSNVGFTASRYFNDDISTVCGSTSLTGTSTNRPNMRFTMTSGCASARQPVVAYIRPVPVVDLGQDINKCVDEGAVEVLDAGLQPDNGTYLWDNNVTTQVRAIDASGTYHVTVTNQYTCKNSDTIVVILRDNPVVELGNDTTVCNGVVLTLDAGTDGVEYFWNTGQTTQTINISQPGSYNVFVTNEQACVKMDTITVIMQGELPTIQGINITNNGQYTFHFTAINPQNVIGYDWDFGDNSPHSYQASPTHTYADNGNYVVVLHLSSTCGFFTDSTSAHIVGINQLTVDNNELTVYPNPTNEVATILNKGALKMEKIELYNVLGQIIYSAKADDAKKHTLKLADLASGLYTIQIYTDKGNVARKLEIVK